MNCLCKETNLHVLVLERFAKCLQKDFLLPQQEPCGFAFDGGGHAAEQCALSTIVYVTIDASACSCIWEQGIPVIGINTFARPLQRDTRGERCVGH